MKYKQKNLYSESIGNRDITLGIIPHRATLRCSVETVDQITTIYDLFYWLYNTTSLPLFVIISEKNQYFLSIINLHTFEYIYTILSILMNILVDSRSHRFGYAINL